MRRVTRLMELKLELCVQWLYLYLYHLSSGEAFRPCCEGCTCHPAAVFAESRQSDLVRVAVGLLSDKRSEQGAAENANNFLPCQQIHL